MIENRARLRVVIVCVVGLALFHLLLGRYEFYPFIHWTMFSQQEHIPTKTSFKRTVLLAIDARQQPHKIYLNHLFATFPGGGGPGQAVTTYYLRRLRQGDQAAVNEVAALIEANTDFGPVVGLQLETHTWFPIRSCLSPMKYPSTPNG
jgi:hypothetical protein